MTIKVMRRGNVLRNIILFTIASFFFNHLIMSLSQGISALNIPLLLENTLSEKLLLVLGLVTVVSSYFGKKITQNIFLLFVLTLTVKVLLVFFNDFNKTVLILDFIFLVSGYYFYILLDLEFKNSVFNPGFHKLDIIKNSQNNIEAKITTLKGKVVEGFLTNWDGSGCFIYLDEQYESITNRLVIEIEFSGQVFSQEGLVVTKYEKGLGIKFLQGKNDTGHGWCEFYDIIHSRGLRPIF